MYCVVSLSNDFIIIFCDKEYEPFSRGGNFGVWVL